MLWRQRIFAGDTVSVSTLLDEGEDVDCANNGGFTPTMLALRYCQLITVRMLFERGADLSRVISGGTNALHLAAWGGHVDCIEWVFANTAIDINSTTNDGNTPIRLALMNS